MNCPECDHDNMDTATHCSRCRTRLSDEATPEIGDRCDSCNFRWTHQIAGRRVCMAHYEKHVRDNPQLMPETCRIVFERCGQLGRAS